MDGVGSDDDQHVALDDTFSTVCGDLGLGDGLRPTSYLQFELGFMTDEPSSSNGKEASSKQSQNARENGRAGGARSANGDQGENQWQEKRLSSDSVSLLYSGKNSREDMSEEVGETEQFPTYADVPYGTSLRQQKKLYEQNLGNILKKHGAGHTSNDGEDKRPTNEEIDDKLHSALQEVEELKLDLEVCRQRLDAKYQAIAVLKKQSDENSHELLTSELKARERNKQLAEEVNKLQFELHLQEASFQDSQQTWSQRFDRVCKENAELISTLDARSEELSRTNAHKLALSHEREELLAMLDMKDRARFRLCHPLLSEEEFSHYSTTELAVLGVCRCHGARHEPCHCAYAAANLMREVCRLRDEARQMLQRRDEAYMTVDAYRQAFEEQLEKSRCLSRQLASLATSASRAVKARAAIKWLLSVLADDDYPPLTRDGGDNSPTHTPSSLEALTLPELVSLLTEMLHEKKEALAHQKLAAQVLAARLHEMERKLQQSSESDGDVHHG
ncbi:coiled-coil domain-containing protein 125-like isoform X2 [Pomacea canaliculata]|uniref:coiled-coil domain-containing protein 125-like isoform X2 n=1 Tax=Pomacea canaliculata TaxID=400727 RepID=UPI000D7277C9|nr:coiled-coil domain-containing protein 125-like isoform X2 [Pomacea canaliculata]